MKHLIKKTGIILLMLALAMSLSAKAKKTITKKIKKSAKTAEQVQYPKSIVTLSPAAAEILYAIGAGASLLISNTILIPARLDSSRKFEIPSIFLSLI